MVLEELEPPETVLLPDPPDEDLEVELLPLLTVELLLLAPPLLRLAVELLREALDLATCPLFPPPVLAR